MKKSLVWRFAVIFVIIAAWTYSFFPLTDKPFYDVLEKEAGERSDAKLQQVITEAKKHDNCNPDSHVSPSKAVIDAADNLKVSLRDFVPIYNQPTASNEAVVDFLRRQAAGKLRLGLDLRGGTEFIIAFAESELHKNEPEKKVEEARDEIIEILRNRVDQSGVVVGRHTGVHRFTIGQRKGLGLGSSPGGAPIYVLALDARDRQVVVGPKAALERTRLTASEVNWIAGEPASEQRVAAQIRHRHPAAPAVARPVAGGRVELVFDVPQIAITPGQALVMYDGDLVVGGGWIE